MFGRWPSAHVGTAFSDQTQGKIRTDAVNLGEIRARKLIHGGSHVEVGFTGLASAVLGLGHWGVRNGSIPVQGSDRSFNFCIAFANAALIEVVQSQRLLERKEMLGLVVAHES